MGEDRLNSNVIEQLKTDFGKDFLVELVETYHQETPQLIEQLRQALADQNSEVFRRSAHSIKSSSASIGATDLSEQARQLEMLGKAGELSGAGELVERLALEYDEVKRRLAEMLNGK